jgi:hypothetical protein
MEVCHPTHDCTRRMTRFGKKIAQRARRPKVDQDELHSRREKVKTATAAAEMYPYMYPLVFINQ